MTMNQNIQQRLLQLLSSDMETVSGTAFEYLCAEVFNLLVGKDIIHKGHNCFMKPVRSSVDMRIEDCTKVVGQAGTDVDYFDKLEKPLNDIKSTIKNCPNCEKLFLFSNRRSNDRQSKALTDIISEKYPHLTVEVYDSERIGNCIIKHIDNIQSISKVLDYLPQSKYFYDMLPKKNTIPAFSGHYFERKDEKEIIKRLESDDCILLYGFSGIGKTELAKCLAHKLSSHFDCLFWIDSTKLDKIPWDSIKVNLSLNDVNLGFAIKNQKSLIIFDNFNSNASQCFKEFELINTHHSKCIITSQVKTADSCYQVREIDQETTSKILKDTSIAPSDEQIEKIYEATKGYPQVLVLLRSSVEQREFTWDEIIETLGDIGEYDDFTINKKLAQRIIGKYVDNYHDILSNIGNIGSCSISRGYFDSSNKSIKIKALERRALISVSDDLSYYVHQVVLDCILSLIPQCKEGFPNNSLLEYLKKNIDAKSIYLYDLFYRNEDFVKKQYSIADDLETKKLILYSALQVKETYGDIHKYTGIIDGLNIDPSQGGLDLRLYIESSEMKAHGLKKTKDYNLYINSVIEKLHGLISSFNGENKEVALHHIGKLYFWLKDYTKAKEIFDEIIKQGPSDYTRLQMARVLDKLNEDDGVRYQIAQIMDKKNNIPLSVVLSCYELISLNKYDDLRKKYIDDNIEKFEEELLLSLTVDWDHAYMVLAANAYHLRYDHQQTFERIMESMPQVEIKNLKDERLLFKIAQVNEAAYSLCNDRSSALAIQYFNTAYACFSNIELDSDFKIKRFMDFLNLAGRYKEALGLVPKIINSKEPFINQVLAKSYCGLKEYEKALECINISLSGKCNEIKPYYKAAFLHDKAIALHGMKSGECYEVMQKAIDMHNKNDIKELWRHELRAWKAEE